MNPLYPDTSSSESDRCSLEMSVSDMVIFLWTFGAAQLELTECMTDNDDWYF